MTGLEYRIASGAGVPILLAIIGILGKKLTRGPAEEGTASWKRSDFYLGVEFCLAGVAAALINLLDLLAKPGRNLQALDGKFLALNILTVIFGMILFMFVLSMHQDYEDESHQEAKRIRELKICGFVCNTMGFAVLSMAVASIPI